MVFVVQGLPFRLSLFLFFWSYVLEQEEKILKNDKNESFPFEIFQPAELLGKPIPKKKSQEA